MTHTFNCDGHGSGHEVPIPKIINRLMTSLLKITLFLMVFLCPSCAQKGYRHFLGPDGIDIRQYIYDSPTGNDIGFYRMNKRIESYEDYLEVKDEMEERTYIGQLNDKKSSSPSSRAKYEQQLKEFKTQLQTKYKDRTHARLLFLQKFYSDLYQLTNKEFTKKYKKNCSRDILDELKYKYRLHHGRKGYAWNVFTDNEKHAASEFRFAYLNGNPENVADKQEALFMFGDSVRHKEPEYRYTNAEDKWYRVSMGRHYVMVQVEGEGKDMLVTGISNPYTRTSVKKQREKRYYFKLL